MDSNTFRKYLAEQTSFLVSDLYALLDLPRERVSNILDYFTLFIRQPAISLLFKQLTERLKFLGESSENVAAFKSLLSQVQNPFVGFETERQRFNYLEKIGSQKKIHLTID